MLKKAENPASNYWNSAWLQQYDLTYLFDTTQKYEWDLPVKVCMFGSKDGEGAVKMEEMSGSTAEGNESGEEYVCELCILLQRCGQCW